MGARIRSQQNISIYKHLKGMELCVFCTISDPKDMLSFWFLAAVIEITIRLASTTEICFLTGLAIRHLEPKPLPLQGLGESGRAGRDCAHTFPALAGLLHSLTGGTSCHSFSKVTLILFTFNLLCCLCGLSFIRIRPWMIQDKPFHLQYCPCLTKS